MPSTIETIGQTLEQKLQEMDPRVRDVAIAGLVALAGLYEERRAKANGRTWRQQADVDMGDMIQSARSLSGSAVDTLEAAGKNVLDSLERITQSRRGQLAQETTQVLPPPTAPIKTGMLLLSTGGRNPRTLYTSDLGRAVKGAWDSLAPTNEPLPIWAWRGKRYYPDQVMGSMRKALFQTPAEDRTISRQELRQRNRQRPTSSAA